MVFEKKYPVKCLLDKWTDTVKRIKLIEEFSQVLDFIPKTSFEFTEDILVYRQERIKHEKLRALNLYKRRLLIEQLAHNLNELEKTGFIHGDINKKNILLSDSKLYLIDLEPSLKQIKRGVDKLMFTPPYISLNDLRNGQLSVETDKIGFYFFTEKMLKPNFKMKNTMELMNQRRRYGTEILPIKEPDFVRLSFSEIFEVVNSNQEHILT